MIVQNGYLNDDSEDDIIKTLHNAKLTDKDAQVEFNEALSYNFPNATLYLLTNYPVDLNVQLQIVEWCVNTPLHIAARADMGPVVIEEMLRRGARSDVLNTLRCTPLSYAAISTSLENINSIVAILRYRSDRTATNVIADDMAPSLIYIVRFRSIDFLKVLLRLCKESGVNVNLNVRNEHGNTPLHYANSLNKSAILMRYGANADMVNNDGEPAWRTNKSIRVQQGIKSIQNMILVAHKMTNRAVRPQVYLPSELLRVMASTLYVGVDDDDDDDDTDDTDDDDDEEEE